MRLFSPFSRRGQAPIASASRNNDLQPAGPRIIRIIASICACSLVFASMGMGGYSPTPWASSTGRSWPG